MSVYFFSVAGYDAAVTIKELRASDLADLENFAKTIPDLVSTYCAGMKIGLDDNQTTFIRQLFLGLYVSDSTKFKFQKGEAVLILQVANFVTRKVTRKDAEDDFSFFRITIVTKKRALPQTRLLEYSLAKERVKQRKKKEWFR